MPNTEYEIRVCRDDSSVNNEVDQCGQCLLAVSTQADEGGLMCATLQHGDVV